MKATGAFVMGVPDKASTARKRRFLLFRRSDAAVVACRVAVGAAKASPGRTAMEFNRVDGRTMVISKAVITKAAAAKPAAALIFPQRHALMTCVTRLELLPRDPVTLEASEARTG